VGHPVALLVLYVLLDFANPLMPGAVGFGPGESIEAVRVCQGDDCQLPGAPGPAARPAATPPPAAPRPGRTSPLAARHRRRGPLRRPRPAHPEPAPRTADPH
jgi:hypothetical protein